MILFVTLVEHIGYQKLHKALSQYLQEIYNVSLLRNKGATCFSGTCLTSQCLSYLLCGQQPELSLALLLINS